MAGTKPGHDGLSNPGPPAPTAHHDEDGRGQLQTDAAMERQRIASRRVAQQANDPGPNA
jgi:hypothetical protein